MAFGPILRSCTDSREVHLPMHLPHDCFRPPASACLLLLACVITAPSVSFAQPATERSELIRVGSKSFTEGILLGQLAADVIREAGFPVVHERSLGDASTFQALVRGDIDVYAEYTGTLRQSILADEDVSSKRELRAALARRGLRMTDSLGFENSFALGTTRTLAERLALDQISDLRAHPELRLGFTESFLNRGDGWPSLRAHYQLPQRDVRGMSHDLAYQSLRHGSLDVVDLYTTDAEIVAYDLVALEDDQEYFPTYEAVYLYRADLARRAPAAVAALAQLEGSISSQQMRRMNAAVKIEGRPDVEVSGAFLQENLGLDIQVQRASFAAELWRRTREHLFLVAVAMLLGTSVALPLGVVAYQRPAAGRLILWMVSVLQTVPSLALLALMVPLLGIKSPPAIAALFCYSMLPIVRNTHAGLAGIPPSLHESARALGLPGWARLRRIELPLAAPMIMAGIKTATVLSIGFATLGAFVGAGGYGQPILTGIRLMDTGEILKGAVPAALLAVACELLFDWGERFTVPRGLRLSDER